MNQSWVNWLSCSLSNSGSGSPMIHISPRAALAVSFLLLPCPDPNIPPLMYQSFYPLERIPSSSTILSFHFDAVCWSLPQSFNEVSSSKLFYHFKSWHHLERFQCPYKYSTYYLSSVWFFELFFFFKQILLPWPHLNITIRQNLFI